jgi:hypothetical protein
MAKAVLIMDDMPECCADCYCGYFGRDTKELNLVCGATGEDANNVGKPAWCPLRELPEKKEEFELRKCKGSMKGTWKVPLIENKGFNTCLDEILKDKKASDSE